MLEQQRRIAAGLLERVRHQRQPERVQQAVLDGAGATTFVTAFFDSGRKGFSSPPIPRAFAQLTLPLSLLVGGPRQRQHVGGEPGTLPVLVAAATLGTS